MKSTVEETSTKPGESVPWLTSCRLTMTVVGMLGAVSLYIQRANMSVAIVCMTTCNKSTSGDNETSYHAEYFSPQMGWGSAGGDFYDASAKGEFDWGRKLRGFILASFYIGYILTQVPGGWLANKFGAKIIILLGQGSLVVLSMLTPVLARVSPYLLMVLQAFKGVVSGVFYPAFFQLLGKWAPPVERSILTAGFISGSSVGSVLSLIVSGILCDHGFAGGWPSIFYVFGIVGGVWCCIFMVMGFDSPEEHPRITRAEREYLQAAIVSKTNKKTLEVPWRALLTTVPIYACFVADVCYAWVWFVALSSLPQYMYDVLDVDIKENGLFSALPYIVNFIITICGSMLADCIISTNKLSVTFIRKLFQGLGLVSSALMSIGVAFLPAYQRALSVTVISLWVGFLGFTRSGSGPNKLEIAPRFSGIIMGIDNMLSTIPGIIAPPIVGAMTPNGSESEWKLVFFMNAGIALFGWFIYMIFGSAKLQEWAIIREEEEEDSDVGKTLGRWGQNAYDIALQRQGGMNNKDSVGKANPAFIYGSEEFESRNKVKKADGFVESTEL